MCKIGLAPEGVRKRVHYIDSQIYYSTQLFSHSIAHKVSSIRTRLLSHLGARSWVVQKRPTNHPHMLHHRSAGLIQQWTCVQRREREWSCEPFFICYWNFIFFLLHRIFFFAMVCLVCFYLTQNTSLFFCLPSTLLLLVYRSFIAPRLESEFLTLFALAVNKLSSYRILHTNRARGGKIKKQRYKWTF